MAKALKFDPSALDAGTSGRKMKAIRSSSEEREAVEIPLDLIDPYTDVEGNHPCFLFIHQASIFQGAGAL